jgi:hypothetical protein
MLATAQMTSAAVEVPSPDEKPFDGVANADTDTLFSCYQQMVANDPRFKAGPPHITETKQGPVLRADFTGPAGRGRLVCTTKDAGTSNGVTLPPLDAAGAIDTATKRAFDEWTARRQTEEQRQAAIGQRPPPDKDSVRFLEGIWLVGADPGHNACLTYGGDYLTQLEFEFAKSGGRLLIFEPPDLFTPVQIAGISRDGARLTIQGRVRGGGLKDLMTIEILDSHRFQTIPKPGTFPKRAPEIAYRCGDPDRTVTSGVTTERLAAILPPISGGWAYPAAVPGVPDAEVCQGKGIPRSEAFTHAYLQLELYGPVHYWIIAYNVRRGKRMVIYDFVRSVTTPGEHILKLKMQAHLEAGDGWDVPKSRGETYDLTVIDRGNRIEVPEFNETFLRCDETESLGMHRW